MHVIVHQQKNCNQANNETRNLDVCIWAVLFKEFNTKKDDAVYAKHEANHVKHVKAKILNILYCGFVV